MVVSPLAADAELDLSWSTGQVTVTFPQLFALPAHTTWRRFVERVLQVDEITSVFVQLGRGTARLAFDERRTTASELLVKVARVLDDPSADVSNTSYIPIDLGREGSLRKSTRFRPLRDQWQVATELTGDVCVRRRLLEIEPAVTPALASRLVGAAVVASVQMDQHGQILRIKHASEPPPVAEIHVLMDQAIAQLTEQYWAAFRDATEGRLFVQGARRLIYVGLTMGGFVMMVIAFILPGIPTPPFLVATTYFGARSSPRFYRWLSRTWLFGRMIRDWRDHRAFRLEDKIKSIVLTLLLIAVGVLLLGIRGPLLIVVLSMAAIEIVWLLGVPQIDALGGGVDVQVAFSTTGTQ